MTIKGQINGKLENLIKNMEVGDEGFTVPWVLSFVPKKDKYDVFLHAGYPIHPETGGTVELYVRRTGPNKNDFLVDLDSVKNYKWSAGGPCYMGSQEDIVNIGELDIF